MTNLRLQICVALTLELVTPGRAVERQLLLGHVPVAALRQQSVGTLPGSTRLNLSIALPLRNSDELSTLLEQLYNPVSPQYRRYLTPEQFAERFGPMKEDYEAVIEFAKSHGFVVTQTHPNRTLLDVSGTVDDVEKTFHITIQLYQYPAEARTFHGPDKEPSIDLQTPILHIGGLNTFSRAQPMVHRKPPGQPGLKPASGSGPGGGFMGNDFRAAYVPGVTLTGAGQAVALVEFDGYYASDIEDYENLTRLLRVPLQNVLIDGADGTPRGDNSEVALDIEMAIAMAPGLSKVVVYEAPNDTTAADDLLNRIATDNLAKQISCSWVATYGQFGDPATTDQIFRQFVAQGQSFFQVSGDFDAYPSSYLGTPTGIPSPCDNPYVTIVGGTELSTSGSGGAWVSETVWNLNYFPSRGYCVGSSGGISAAYSIPSWQQGLSMAANHGSTTHRNFPDVAMVADNIWQLSDNGDAYVTWGTSASAPLWAGFTAMANELADAYGLPSVGFINPAIYSLSKGTGYSSTFHDVTTGDNNNTIDHTGFPAVPGFDLATGWGTPNGSNLLYALALPQLLQITPGDVIASGPGGGPFNPTAQEYSLTNAGGTSLEWALGYTASWLDASATSGTLAPGAPPATVTLSVNSQATSLPVGTYFSSLCFTNLTDGSVQTRLFTLSINGPLAIISWPTNQTVPDGGTAIFSVVTASNGLVNCFWDRVGTPLIDDGRISGSATSTLVISNVSAADAGNYRILVSNPVGFTGNICELLTIPSSPTIIQPPSNQTVLPGATATFAVTAVGTQPLFYQWQSHGTNLTSGGTSNVLTLRNVAQADVGAYSVIISNAVGSVTNDGAVLAIIPVVSPEVTMTNIYSFRNSEDGTAPNGLAWHTNGFLYATASVGGASGMGTAFRITTDGAFTLMRAFTGGNDGGSPKGRLIQATDGNLYGTASSGGANYGGTVFRLTPNGSSLSTVHAFGAGTDGAVPVAGVMQSTDGYLYGTTGQGGTDGAGIVFKMSLSGAIAQLHGFGGADGANPNGGLAQGSDGNFYGTTRIGGPNRSDGTVFKIGTNGGLTTLFSFDAASTNGFGPRGDLVRGRDGNFYGITRHGGVNGHGTVFRITPAGLLTTIHAFNGEGDGQWPVAGLLEGQDGYFYGTTSYGGSYGDGTVFRISPSGVLTTLVYFVGYNGANSWTPLVQAPDGTLFGTAINGGANGYGTIFRLSVPALALKVALSGGQLVLSWPSWAADLHLQEASDLTSGNWSNVTTDPEIVDQQKQVVLPIPVTGNAFYRLMH